MSWSNTYDIHQSMLTIGSVPVTGYADGEAAAFAISGTDWTTAKGSHGGVNFIRQYNGEGKATVRLMKGNPVNAQLEALRQLSLSTGASHALVFRDLLGGDKVVCVRCKFEKVPDLKAGSSDTPVEWSLLMANPEITHGVATAV